MSNIYRPQGDYRNWWQLGQTVEFDGPYGERLTGTLVRTSSNPTYIHVEVNGRRYEADIVDDNASIVWD
jgi:hypothetical protein